MSESLAALLAIVRNLPSGAYGTIAGSHQVSGTSVRRVEIEPGATGRAVLLLIVGSIDANDDANVNNDANGRNELK